MVTILDILNITANESGEVSFTVGFPGAAIRTTAVIKEDGTLLAGKSGALFESNRQSNRLDYKWRARRLS